MQDAGYVYLEYLDTSKPVYPYGYDVFTSQGVWVGCVEKLAPNLWSAFPVQNEPYYHPLFGKSREHALARLIAS